MQDQDNDNEFERMSGEDLQELSKQKDWHSDLIENAFNKFMVLYFRLGYTYDEALKKTEQQLRETFKLNDEEVTK